MAHTAGRGVRKATVNALDWFGAVPSPNRPKSMGSFFSLKPEQPPDEEAAEIHGEEDEEPSQDDLPSGPWGSYLLRMKYWV